MYSNGQNLGSIPPAAYGNPMIPMSYEQQVAYAHDLRRQQREFIEKRLKENYPAKFALVYSVILIFLSIAQIALHIVLAIFNGALYYIFHGVWGGLITLIIPLFPLLLIKFPKYSLYMATLFINMFIGIFINMAIALISGIGISEYNRVYSRYSKETSSQTNKDMLPVTATMLALAIIAFFLTLVYMIVVGRIFRKPRATANYNGSTFYPNNVTTNPTGTFYPQKQASNIPAPNNYTSNPYPTIPNSSIY